MHRLDSNNFGALGYKGTLLYEATKLGEAVDNLKMVLIKELKSSVAPINNFFGGLVIGTLLVGLVFLGYLCQ